MAGAAAKKSAAARAATEKTYQPLLAIANAVYLVLFAIRGNGTSLGTAAIHVLLFGLQLYAYMGILDDAVTNPKVDDKLVGGASLDLLAFTLLLQFLGGLLSRRFYYLLGVLPIWGAWKLYTLFYGGQANNTFAEASSTPEVKEEINQRRQKRAEKRQQKWS